MGRWKQKKTQKRDFKVKKDNVWAQDSSKARLKPGDIISQFRNQNFEEYYKAQQICPPEDWDAFLDALRRPLPSVFRINGSGRYAEAMKRHIQTQYFDCMKDGVTIDQEHIAPPFPLPWYPKQLAWQLGTSRKALRSCPQLQAVHSHLVKADSLGTVTRQEAVSMIPPLLLDVGPDHWVLDMCAAPGSKTFQLLELQASHGVPATGVVVANDVDPKRCNLLTHQTKRMCSPNLAVTNHPGQAIPSLKAFNKKQGRTMNEGSGVQFDRVLCDVPCSGDGTMRKAPDIWRSWRVANGNSLHTLQVKITLKGCHLLKVGGRLVYSTCTFNPIEDEAVVAEVLRRCGGSMRLVDVSDQLTGLKRRNGVNKWLVHDGTRFYESWQCGKQLGYRLEQSMFADEQSREFPLHLCMRVLPHEQDTGGFFIAVMEKMSDTGPFSMPNRTDRRQKQNNRTAQPPTPLTSITTSSGQDIDVQNLADCADNLVQDSIKRLAWPTSSSPSDIRQYVSEALRVLKGMTQAVEHAQQSGLISQQEEALEGGQGKEQGDGGGVQCQDGVDNARKRQGQSGEDCSERGGGGGGDETEAKHQNKRIKTEEDGAVDGKGGADKEAADGGGGAVSIARGGTRGMDPIYTLDNMDVINGLSEFFGLTVPLAGRLITRTSERLDQPKKLYFMSEGLGQLLLADNQGQMRITSIGLKMFDRSQEFKDSNAVQSYRVLQEGLPTLLPHITRQKLFLPADLFVQLVTNRIVALPRGTEYFHPGDKDFVNMLNKAEENNPTVANAVACIATANMQGTEGAEIATENNDGGGAAAGAGSGGAEQGKGADSGGTEQGQGAAEGGGGDAGKNDKVREIAERVFVSDEGVLAQLSSIRHGSCIAMLTDEACIQLGLPLEKDWYQNGGITGAAPVAVSCWRGRSNLTVMVSVLEGRWIGDKVTEALNAVQGGTDKGGSVNGPVPVVSVKREVDDPWDLAVKKLEKRAAH